MVKKKKTDVLVAPHTHWDRAWYWPFERFRVRLIECMKAVIAELKKHPEYRFTCDGQTLMVEDYLEVCPEDEAFLKKAARSGRLVAGPMYCLADLYCTGGEALIRNLLLGKEFAGKLGRAPDVTLHMPDTFGIIPSIPMIAAGFGFQCFTFMRGWPGDPKGWSGGKGPPARGGKEARIFRWRAADGSEVRVVRLREGYANAANLGRPPGAGLVWEFDESVALGQLIEAARNQRDSQGPPLLLLAGVDHQIPQPQLTDALRKATRKSNFHFRYSDLDEMGREAVRNRSRLPLYRGEFHGKGNASVLGGTVSSRIYLKQNNAAAERSLVCGAEPAAALARLLGQTDPAEASLAAAWKHLLKTHPHDDICGCSADPVHQDNEYEMRQAATAADAVRRRMGRRILEVYGGNRAGDERFSFFLFNTQPNPWSGRVRVKCDFEGRHKWGDIQPPEHYAVVDEAGREIPFFEAARGAAPDHPHQRLLLDLYPAGMPPMSLRRFFIEERPRWPSVSAGRKTVIENERLKVKAGPNGTFDLEDKQTGKVFPGLGVLSGQADTGDLYDFSDLPGDKEILFDKTRWAAECIQGYSGARRLRLAGLVSVPETSSMAAGRSRKKTPLPVTVELTLAPRAEHLDYCIRFTNTAKDHRLRFNLPLPFRPRESRAGLKFNEVIRPAGKQPRGTKPPRVHPEHPADHFAAAEVRQGGLALFSEFPFNYEIVSGRTSRLAVALLRSVGYISNPLGTTTRSNKGAGPGTPAPEGQCLGRSFEMRFAIRPYAAKESGRLFYEAFRWRNVPFYGQIESCDPPRAEKSSDGPFAAARNELAVTALKPKQNGKGVILRLFNPFSKRQTAKLFFKGVRQVRLTGLREEPLPESPPAGSGVLKLDFPPFSLRTLEIREPLLSKPRKTATR